MDLRLSWPKDKTMEDFTDTHLCLACQTTLIGLDNYVLHKREACPAGEQVREGAKINHNLGRPDSGGGNILGPYSHSHQGVRPAENDRHFTHGLQAQNSVSTHSSGGAGYLPLPTCQNGTGLSQQSVLSSTSDQSSTTYLHSQTHLTLDSTNHSLSSLIGVHSSSGHFHHSSAHQLDDLTQLHPPNHALSTDLVSTSGHKLPSIRTFRSSTRLLPNITREPSGGMESSSSQQQQPLNSVLPFSHHFQANTREHLSTADHLDVHTSQSLPSTASSLGLNLATCSTPYTSTGLTSYTATPLSSMTLPSTDSHNMQPLSHQTAATPLSSMTLPSGSDSHNMQGLPQSAHTDQTSGLEVPDGVVSFVSTLSPTSSRVVDPNMVLYDGLHDKDTTFTDFFSSLELQYRVETDGPRPIGDVMQKTSPNNYSDGLKIGADGRLDIDHNRALNIANLINELAFSSDSDNFLPSDTENLFDSSDDEGGDMEGTNQSHNVLGISPSVSHTTGKWVPGQKPTTPRHQHQDSPGTSGKWNSVGKVLPASKPLYSTGKPSGLTTKVTGGKVRTGLGKGKAMGGKWKAGENVAEYEESEGEDKGELSDDEQDPDDDDNEPQRITKGKHISRGKVFPSGKQIPADKTYHCKPCDRTLLNKVSYERHCSTTAHIKRAKNQDPEQPLQNTEKGKESPEKRTEEVENIECTVCSKTFNNRYNFARHLVSGYHQRKALTDHKVMLLDEPYQLLLSRQSRFQCHICKFYCNTSEQLNVHVFSLGHADAVGSLAGPLLCVRCKFASRSNTEMLDHIEGEQHQKTITESDRPCVLRESRYRMQCRSCDNIFHRATHLKKHMETVHGDQLEGGQPMRSTLRGKGPPVCPYCQTKWKSFAGMEVHIRRKHTFEKPFKCEECNKGYADKYGLTLHFQSKKHLARLVELGDMRPVEATSPTNKKTNGKVTHKCKLCDYVADKYTELRPHFLEHHLDSVLECTTCGVKFVSQSSYNNHMNSKMHLNTEEEALHSTATFTCNVCGKKFYSSKRFVLHKLVHRHVVQQNKKQSVSQVRASQTGISSKYDNYLKSIQDVNYNQRVKCPVCHREITKQQIHTHLRIHDGVSPFGCIYCTQTFACPKSLQRHLAGHLGIRCHTCRVCEKKFSRERALVMHMKTAHSSEKKERLFTCNTCGASVKSKWKLRLHIIGHNKPVKCKAQGCDMRFRTESSMIIHHRTHTKEKPYLCDQCGYAAPTKQHLNRHRRTHTGERRYQCEYCEYRAINSTNLGRHMRIHIGTKPYKCPYCDLTCNTLENIRKHVTKTKKHAGKPVYPCRICNNYGTNSAAEFKTHLTQVHDISEQSIEVLSEYAGLYSKVEDVKTLPEGACVIQRKYKQGKSQESKPKKTAVKKYSKDPAYIVPHQQAKTNSRKSRGKKRNFDTLRCDVEGFEM